ncbi:hypothetical protein SDC9_209024 [bioreactor metagenome]|uniref:Uncharacterized protein n=1 Tax=bioreactor metagenome TaxID=1076179 RepID=A0A645JF44_9ZZZZ
MVAVIAPVCFDRKNIARYKALKEEARVPHAKYTVEHLVVELLEAGRAF